MKIFIIGFMGAGKTTQGKRLAGLLGFQFIDLDDFIVEKSDESVTEIFDSKGENYFRKVEAECLRILEKQKNTVISVGGGTPCFYENMSWMKRNGLTVYLKMDAETIYSRLKNAKNNRPLIANKSEDEFMEYIHKTLADREPFYLESAKIIEARSLKTAELLKIIDLQ